MVVVCIIYIFLHPFSWIVFQSDNLYFIGLFNPFTFNVIINIGGTILLLFSVSVISYLFLYSSFTGI